VTVNQITLFLKSGYERSDLRCGEFYPTPEDIRNFIRHGREQCMRTESVESSSRMSGQSMSNRVSLVSAICRRSALGTNLLETISPMKRKPFHSIFLFLKQEQISRCIESNEQVRFLSGNRADGKRRRSRYFSRSWVLSFWTDERRPRMPARSRRGLLWSASPPVLDAARDGVEPRVHPRAHRMGLPPASSARPFPHSPFLETANACICQRRSILT
jgi:hypothetical protein